MKVLLICHKCKLQKQLENNIANEITHIITGTIIITVSTILTILL